jgi:Uma2 family endonuclease
MRMEISFEATTTMSPTEFEQWVAERTPSDLNHYELLNGRVVMTPPAGYPHGSVEAKLVHRLCQAAGVGQAFGSSQGFVLPDGSTIEPDFSWVGAERWTAMGKPTPGRFLHVVPDLLVEIASPSTRLRDRSEKKAAYERAGVREYWIVDPESQSVTIFEAGQHRFDAGRVAQGAERLRSAILPSVDFEARELFPDD